MSDPRLLIFTHDRIRKFFDVDIKTGASRDASALVNALGDQLLGLVVLDRLRARGQLSPEQRSFYEMNVVMDRFVKEVLFGDDAMEFRMHFEFRNPHSVGDIFEAWIFFAYEAHDRNLEKLTNVLKPYLEWVESAVDFTKTQQISKPQPPEEDMKISFDDLESELRKASRAERLAGYRAKVPEGVVEATPPVSVAPLMQRRNTLAHEHVIPTPLHFEWVTRTGSTSKMDSFFCCGQLAFRDENDVWCSTRECHCPTSMAEKNHNQPLCMWRTSRNSARSATPIGHWQCCKQSIHPLSAPDFIKLPTITSHPCLRAEITTTRKRPRNENEEEEGLRSPTKGLVTAPAGTGSLMPEVEDFGAQEASRR